MGVPRKKSRQNVELCQHCDGTGRTSPQTFPEQQVKAGNASYIASLKKGAMSMSERGKRGGRPRRTLKSEVEKFLSEVERRESTS